MKNKHVGFLVLGITIIFALIVLSFNRALDEIINTSCSHGVSCPMHATLLTQEVISYSLVGILALVSLFIIFFMKDERTIVKVESKQDLSDEERKKKLQDLDDDERSVMNIILRENGSVYQSDIVKETKLTKVKTTRILDKLEGKGLIERRRRGMSNIIILK
jgi:uncharacterized membrane protein